MPEVPPPDVSEEPAYEARILRAYLREGRLVTLPARERKRRVILRFLVGEVFPDDSPIDEPEVNARIARWHPDFAALRRYLVDAGLVTRDGMTYRRVRPSRTGPPFV